MIVSLLGTVYVTENFSKVIIHREIPEELLFRNDLGDYYKLVRIKGSTKGVLRKDTTVSFIYEKVGNKKKIQHKNLNLSTIRENIYMGKNLNKFSPSGDPRGYVTSELVKQLSGRLLFGTKEL